MNEEWVRNVEKRLNSLENWREIDAERRLHMDKRFNELERQIEQVRKGVEIIHGYGKWLVLLIVGLILTAVLQWVLQGGLNVAAA